MVGVRIEQVMAEADTLAFAAERTLAFAEQVLAQQQQQLSSRSLQPCPQTDGDGNREQHMLEQLLPTLSQDDLQTLVNSCAALRRTLEDGLMLSAAELALLAQWALYRSSLARREERIEALSGEKERMRVLEHVPNKHHPLVLTVEARKLLAMLDTGTVTVPPPSPRKRPKLCLGGPVTPPLAKHAPRRSDEDVADAQCGCIFNLEINEGAEAMTKKEYYLEYGATTACDLRLSKEKVVDEARFDVHHLSVSRLASICEV